MINVGKALQKKLAVLLAAVLFFNGVPDEGYAFAASLTEEQQEEGIQSVSGNDISGGNVSGGDVSGGDVSGGNVSGGDAGLLPDEGFGFAVAEPEPVTYWENGFFSNEAAGGKGTGKITYSVSSGDAATVDEDTGVVAFVKAGEVEICARRESDGIYQAVEAGYLLKIEKAKQTGFGFVQEAPEDIWMGEESFRQEASGGQSIYAPEYAVAEGAEYASVDKKTGEVSFICPGTIKVEAVKAGDDCYESISASYYLTIVRKEQPDMHFLTTAPGSVTYVRGGTYVNAVSGGDARTAADYSVISGDAAEVDQDGVVTFLKAGKVTVNAQKKKSLYYEGGSCQYDLEILPGVQPDFAVISDVQEMVYNENNNEILLEVDGLLSTGSVRYEIVSGDACELAVQTEEQAAGNTAILKVLKAGTVAVKAYAEADDCYGEAETPVYEITISRADPELAFAQPDPSDILYGQSFANEAVSLRGSEGAVSYSVISGEEIADVDESGALIFKDQGTGLLRIRAEIEEDDRYSESFAEYELTVAYQETPEKAYEITGEQLNESGWYTGDITVSAPEGYLISESNSLSGVDWTDSLVWEEEGQYAKTVYLKQVAAGGITDAITIDDIKIDKTNPENLNIIYEIPVSEYFLEGISFGFYQAKARVTLHAEDRISGISKLTYSYTVSEGAGSINQGEQNITVDVSGEEYSFEIPAQFKGQISFVAEDEAGRISVLDNDGKGIVVDNIAPELSILRPQEKQAVDAGLNTIEGYDQAQNDSTAGLYYDDDFTLTFCMKEANFFAEDVHTFVNGEERELSWTESGDEDVWKAELLIEGEGHYVVTMEYTDRSTNEMKKYTSEKITIDKTDPTVKVVYPEEGEEIPGEIAAVIAGRRYYAAEETVEIRIREHNFRADDVEVTVTAQDAAGNPVEGLSEGELSAKYHDYLCDRSSWTQDEQEEDVYIARIPYDVDGNYTFTITYQDLARREIAPYGVDELTVDRETPVNLEITYSEAEKEDTLIGTLLSTLSYRRFYQDKVLVTLTAEDATSGICGMKYFYEVSDGVSPVNQGGSGSVSSGDLLAEAGAVSEEELIIDGDIAVYSFYIEPQFRGQVRFTAIDRAGYESSCTDRETEIVVDDISPELSVLRPQEKQAVDAGLNTIEGYDQAQNDSTAGLYYDDDFTLTFCMKEANFFAEDVHTFVNGEERELSWTESGDEDVWKAELLIEGEGHYVVTMEYTDRSTNEMKKYTSEKITIDKTDPTVKVVYPEEREENPGEIAAVIAGRRYYAAEETVEIRIREHNFRADDVEVTVTAQDAARNPVEGLSEGELSAKYHDYLCDRSSWTQDEQEEDVYIARIPYDVDGNYTFTITYQDLARREIAPYGVDELTVDRESPVNLEVTYSEAEKEDTLIGTLLSTLSYRRFYQDKVLVTLTAEDATSGICGMRYFYEVSGDASPVNQGGSGSVSSGDLLAEAGAVSEEALIIDGDTAAYSFYIEPQFRGQVRFTATDRAGYESSCTDRETEIVVDNISPAGKVTITGPCTRMVDSENKTVEVADKDTRYLFDGEITALLHMEEANFFPEDVKVTVLCDGEIVQNGMGYTYDAESWNEVLQDCYEVKIGIGRKDTQFNDGDYVLKIEYSDRSRNETYVYQSNILTVDTTAPEIDIVYDNNEANNAVYYDCRRTAVVTVTDRNIRPQEIETTVLAKDVEGKDAAFSLEEKMSTWEAITAWEATGEPYQWQARISYDVDANYDFHIVCPDMTEHVTEDRDNFTVDETMPDTGSFDFSYSTSILDRLISTVSYKYYKPSVTVTLTAEDVTSGIDYFDWRYRQEQGTSDKNVTQRQERIGRKAITFSNNGRTAAAQFTLTAEEARQYRGNISFSVTDMAGNISNEKTDSGTIIVVDNISPSRSVEYSPARQVVNKNTLFTRDGYSYTAENTASVLYYDDAMTVTFRINEANFYAEDVVIRVNGKTQTPKDWKQSGDEWTGSISISGDGDYFVTMEYADRSSNEMISYVSEQITIDMVNPVVKVNYALNDPVRTIEGRKYFAATQTATVTITEHNFRAEDVVAVITATDVNKGNISIQDYADYLRKRTSWTSNGDEHTATITYNTDANYTFDISYKDLALRETDDYKQDLFTVDKQAPVNLQVAYSTNIFEIILQTITFGFYNAQMTVTMTAEDTVSGVYEFVYSYLKADGVSVVNAELIEARVSYDAIRYSNGMSTATAVFQIPGSVLQGNNQFNGTVNFSVIDRSGLKTDLKDTRRIVVDNISPSATVEYNDPDRTDGGVAYYRGEIRASIRINEANFYAEDVDVTISKDGGSQEAVNVAWTDENVDSHLGTFTLNSDGDYIVHVNYHDRSQNEMAAYESGQLTIDTQQPQIRVSGIRNRSANNAEQIGFVVTVEDTNFDADSFQPVLMAEIRDKNGAFKTVDMSAVGKITAITAGNRYIYTVSDLEEDGIYTLSCQVSDQAGNEQTEMFIEESDQMSESLTFSVNRKGSVYSLTEETRKLNGSFAKKAVDVVLTEINATRLSNIRITLFKNEKTIILKEGTDYRVDIAGGDGEWYIYTYTIFKENFEDDGVYRLSIYSEDEAGNVAENTLDVKNVELSFGVDKTAPNLIVTNLESGETYPVELLAVLMQASDNMKLVSVEVILDEEIYRTWDEDEIEKMAAEMQDFTFDISGESTKAHNLKIVLTDIAGNETVMDITDFYVTTNLWVRYYNNKPLFFGSIGGVLLLILGITIIILLAKRRKEEKSEEA